MIEIDTEIIIHAPPAAVWRILTDFPAYPRWNPFIRSISAAAPLAAGARLAIEVHPPGKRPMRFRPTVLAAHPEHELRWIGRLLVPGLFDGEHSFELRPAPDHPHWTHLSHRERFTGLLHRMLPEAATRAGFTAMNQALKARAEGAAAL